MIDHVTKSKEDRGRYAIGAQHKLAAIDGAVFGLEMKQAFVKGAGGQSLVRVHKDRPGGIHPQAPNRVLGRFVLAPKANGTVAAYVQAPDPKQATVAATAERDVEGELVELLMARPDELMKSELRAELGANSERYQEVFSELENEGVIRSKKTDRVNSKGQTQNASTNPGFSAPC